MQMNGYYTIIFGGVSLERNIISLLVIVLVTQSVAVMTLAIKGMVKGRRSSVVKEVNKKVSSVGYLLLALIIL